MHILYRIQGGGDRRNNNFGGQRKSLNWLFQSGILCSVGKSERSIILILLNDAHWYFQHLNIRCGLQSFVNTLVEEIQREEM